MSFQNLARPATIPRARATETGQKRIHYFDSEKPELKGRQAVPFSEKRRLLLRKKWPVSDFSCTVADDLASQLSCYGASYPLYHETAPRKSPRDHPLPGLCIACR
jgi:hypothetical protein